MVRHGSQQGSVSFPNMEVIKKKKKAFSLTATNKPVERTAHNPELISVEHNGWMRGIMCRPTCPLKASMMKCNAWGWTHSIHFCTTWLPFWSFTHFSTWPSSSLTISLWRTGDRAGSHDHLCQDLA